MKLTKRDVTDQTPIENSVADMRPKYLKWRLELLWKVNYNSIIKQIKPYTDV